MQVAVFILAGGSGIRLWPLSRQEKPKQFLPVFSDGTSFFEKTLSRAKKITSPENIYILTQKNYKDLVKALAEDIPENNIITEAEKKNTAPVIAYAMARLHKENGNSTAVIMPSDHYITDEKLFTQTVIKACAVAKSKENLCTIGITPTRPATTYGYIEYDNSSAEADDFTVLSFTEKPCLETAKSFLSSEKYLWNSGIFIWKTKTILKAFESCAPELYELSQAMCRCENEAEKDRIFSQMPCVSIDYAILEKSHNISVLKGCFGWDDIGSWERYEALLSEDENNNRKDNDSILIDTRNCTAITLNSKTLMLGTENIFVINTGDAVLIFPEDKAGDIGNLTDILNSNGLGDLL